MIEQLKNKLIVSCQAKDNEPLKDPQIMAKMAAAALLGGAGGIRAAGVNDIKAIKAMNETIVIGLIKKDYSDSEVYITPTKQEVFQLLESGCEIIALDGTNRNRPNKETLFSLISLIHANNRLAMADISTFEEALLAQQAGADMVSTTLSGYTSYTKKRQGPDIKLVGQCVSKLQIPVLAEGRIRNPQDLKKVLRKKPFAVVIGTAITRPTEITKTFVGCFK
ncbi:MAG: N-acetylmannosamine-6-phosphate 2-epimerase [Bacilli bacterium]